MTEDDIYTWPGYPRHVSSRHVRTLLLFFYKTDCQLCRTVNRYSRRRRRRQVQAEGTQLILPNDFVHEVLNYQA